MSNLIHGIDVVLYTKTQSGEDDFGAPIYTETEETVENVLVGSPTEEEILSDVNLYGRRAQYILGIPKGDTHDWENVKVSFELGGETITCKTFGMPIMGIEDLIPLDWNKKVRCEHFNGDES